MALTKQKRHTLRERLAARGFEANAHETMAALAEFMGATTPEGTSLVLLVELRVQLDLLLRNVMQQDGLDPAHVQGIEDRILEQKDAVK